MTLTPHELWAVVAIAQIISMLTAIIVAIIIANTIRSQQSETILVEVERLLYCEYHDDLQARMTINIDFPIHPTMAIRIALAETPYLFGQETFHLHTVIYDVPRQKILGIADSMRFKDDGPGGTAAERWRRTVQWHLDHGWEFAEDENLDWGAQRKLMEDDDAGND